MASNKTIENWKPIQRGYKQHPHFLQQFTSPITNQKKNKTNQKTKHLSFDEFCNYRNRKYFTMQ